MLKVSASSPFRPAHAPNSADTIAVQIIMMVVAIHDWRRAGNLVGCPSSDEVSLFASKPSLSSDFTGLYDSVRFCALMPNILMVQMKRRCKKEKSWEKDDDKTHGYAEIIATTFLQRSSNLFLVIQAMASLGVRSLARHTIVFKCYPAKADNNTSLTHRNELTKITHHN